LPQSTSLACLRRREILWVKAFAALERELGAIRESGDTATVFSPPYHPYTQLLVPSVPEMRPDWLDGVLAVRAAGAAATAGLMRAPCKGPLSQPSEAVAARPALPRPQFVSIPPPKQKEETGGRRVRGSDFCPA